VKPRLLDLFCGAGGATKGYQRAGFHVVGVDVKPQPNYCGDEFHQADALEYVVDHGESFDAIHASPPCQAYIRGGSQARDGRHPKLIEPVRETLRVTRHPYVIENVPGAPLLTTFMLCGSMFGLPIRRHRLFEMRPHRFDLVPPCDHSQPIVGVYGNPHGKRGAWKGMLTSDLATWSRAMGIDWMTAKEIALAIPPVYTEWIGRRLMAHATQGITR
jgi:DNA (cytosine-5)-methyltransferase 1